MDSVDHYRELYNVEWSRRDQLGSATGVPIAVLTLVGGILAYVGQAIDLSLLGTGWTCLVTGAVASIFFIAAAYCLVRSYHGYTYRQVSFPEELRAWEDEIQRLCQEAGKPTRAQQAIADGLRLRYSQAADTNARNNVRRSEYLFLANRWTIFAFIFAAAGGSVAVANVRSQSPRATVIRILPTEDYPSMPKETPKDSGQKPTKLDTLPPPPPNTDVRTQIPKTKTE